MVMLVVPLGNSDPKSESHRLHEPTLGGYKKKLVHSAEKILRGDDFILYSDVLSTVRASTVLGRFFVPIFCLFSELAGGCRPCF